MNLHPKVGAAGVGGLMGVAVALILPVVQQQCGNPRDLAMAIFRALIPVAGAVVAGYFKPTGNWTSSNSN